MADLTTYEGLKAAVADYLGRDDRADTDLHLAEKRLERDMRLRVMEHRAVRPVAAGTKGVKLPGAGGTPPPPALRGSERKRRCLAAAELRPAPGRTDKNASRIGRGLI